MLAKATPIPQPSMILPMLQLIWRPLATLQWIHETYGERVLGRLFGRRILFVCAPDDIEYIFNLEGKGLLSRDFLYDAKRVLFGNGLVNSPNQIWSRQRRLMQPLFTKQAVMQWEAVIVNEAQSVAQRLQTADQANLTVEIKILIQRIFLQVLLGKSVEQIDNSAELIDVIDRICREIPFQIGSEIVFGKWLKRIAPSSFKGYYSAVDYLKQFIGEQIALKRQNPGQDLISQLLLAEDKNSGYAMPADLLQDEAVNLFFAGQETTINTLVWFFYLTGKHAEVRRKIIEEIRCLPDGVLCSADFGQLPYTRAALNETLRMYPPTSALSTHTVADIELAGETIPRATTVMLSMYATHHNPRIWENPQQFRPERFLDATEAARHRYAFFPFGGGLHNCIGKHFAELEMLLIIASFYRHFSFETEVVAGPALSVTLKPDCDVSGQIKTLI